MSITIFQENKTYHLQGNLTKQDSEKVFSYFTEELENKSEVAVNVDQVHKIDVYGMAAINDLVAQAIKEKKSFKVSGWGHDDVVEFFFLTDVA